MGTRSLARCLRLGAAAGALALVATPALGATTTLPAEQIPTRTPIKHLVVIFQENRAYDHYFGTYPRARNLPGETRFRAKPNTPQTNGLSREITNFTLSPFKPYRLPPSQAATCDRDHKANALQEAFNHGLMDNFPFATYESTTIEAAGCVPRLGMGHYDGNTVTALWNYAQNYAMSDNFYTTFIGPSTPGHLNLIAGETGPATVESLVDGDEILVADRSVVADPDPANDLCSSEPTVTRTGRNIGDLLATY
jgi:phospholipase C